MVVGERGKALLAQFYQKHGCLAISDVSRQDRKRASQPTTTVAALSSKLLRSLLLFFGLAQQCSSLRWKGRRTLRERGGRATPRAPKVTGKSQQHMTLSIGRPLAASCCTTLTMTTHVTPISFVPTTPPSSPRPRPVTPRGLHRGFVRLRIAHPRGSNKAGSGGVQCMAGSQTDGGGLVFFGRAGVSALQVLQCCRCCCCCCCCW